MKPIVSRTIAALLVVIVGWPLPASTQAPAPPAPAEAQQGAPAFKPEELDQLVAPLALYPDALLAQTLMASTYPLDVVQAARFAKSNAGLKGDQLSEALKAQPWDDSVKSLVSFPQVLTMMNDKLDWTQKLGDAFLGQQKDLMDAVQRLRAKAEASGNLKSNAEQTVTVQPAPPQTVIVQQAPPTVITIVPTNPQVIYVPTYNPTVVYGAWPYPAYPPYSYYPPGYVAAAGIVSFGIGMAVGASLWGNCNWGRGDVNVNVNQYNSYTRNVNSNNAASDRMARVGTGQGGQAGQGNWQHDAARRGQVPYRNQATAQTYGRGRSQDSAMQSREAFRGRTQQGGFGQASAGGQGGVGQGRAGGGFERAGAGGGVQGGGGRAGGGSGGFQGRSEPGAFQGIGQGREMGSASARGGQSLGSSRSGGGRGAGAGGGGGGGGGGGRAGGGGGGGGGKRR